MFPIVKTADELAFEERQKADEAASAQKQQEESQRTELVSHIIKIWGKAKAAKETVAKNMIEDVRQRNAEYDSVKLAQITAIRQPPIYMKLTNMKCRSMEAWIREILNQPGQRPFAVEATPVPELPAEIEAEIKQKFYREAIQQILMNSVQSGMPVDSNMIIETIQEMMPEFEKRLRKVIQDKAKEAAEGMSKEIDDQFTEGGWYKAIDQCIYDIVTLRAAILKGPIVRRENVRRLSVNQATGVYEVAYEERTIPQYDRVSPFDFFPLWDTGAVNDGDIIERIYYRPDQLSGMIGLPAFRDDELRLILREYGEGRLTDWETDIDQERTEQEQLKRDGSYTTDRTKIACLEWWGATSGKKLTEYGVTSDDDTPLDPAKFYHAKAWLIGQHIIKAALNEEPNGEKPYSTASLEEIPESIWGRGLPALLSDIQQICNACARALLNNVAIASGPQVDIDKSRYPAGYDMTIWPWKVWESNGSDVGDTDRPIKFYVPPFVAEKLIAVYTHFSKIADEVSVPAYAHGDTNVGGAGNTLGGLSMLMRGGARGVQTVIRNIDNGLIATSATRQFYYNLANNPRKAIIGDLKVVARGSSHLTIKEQEAIRMKEFARDTNNPLDAQITGLEGRRYLLQSAAKALNIDPEEAFPEPGMATPMNPMLMPGVKPANNAPNAQTLDAAGNPAQGKDFMAKQQ